MSPARIMSSTLMVSAQSASAAAASAWLYPRAASAATASPRLPLPNADGAGGQQDTRRKLRRTLADFSLSSSTMRWASFGAHTRGGGQRLESPAMMAKATWSAVSDERMAMATLAPTPLTWVSIRKQLRSVWVEKPSSSSGILYGRKMGVEQHLLPSSGSWE